MKKNILFALFIFLNLNLILNFASCSTTDPKLEPDLKLELKDVSCTEAWLQLTTNNIQLPATITLLKNNSVAQTFSLSTQDSLLYIDSLLPNQNYYFQVSSIQHQVSSIKQQVTTMDTTSHNFTWQTFTFGEHQHSVLYDVAVIDENNIWAVGEIYMNDSLGYPDPNAYNAIHWNGSEWELKKIAVTYNGNETIAPLKGIFVLQTGEIIFSSGLPYLPQGNSWKLYHLRDMGVLDQNDGSVERIWGTSMNNLYFLGYKGTIVHYQNGIWTKIESGLSIDFWGIWGNSDVSTIWACGYTDDYANSALIRIKDGVVEKIFEGLSNSQNNGYYVGPMSGVWSDNNYRVFLMNWEGVYLQQNNNQLFLEKEIAGFSDVGLGIDGTLHNNLFVCGQRLIGHWNGYTYKEYPELILQQRTFKSVKTNANTVCAVGRDYNSPIYSNAVIVLGK